ncbi:DUF4279 domain-containing protein [Desulfopila sp. IMCC35008]|uniref:DUF4279 domain-containing protein n=1 Tax=Desulfopila sp. IMCC35008 TaxID=2653858 RepID=UPI0013D7E5A9|nr:DUF4279 domain-containing protein [Desulfopila sp. IMCC35008]
MSCVLRVWGNEFDVDSITLEPELEAIKVWRKGQPKFNSNPNSRLNETSGLSIELSSSDFSEIEKQINEAISFCKSHQKVLTKLVSHQGVDGAVADFGAEIYPPGWCSFYFEPELLKILGNIGISLGLSVYPTDNEDETE